MMTLITIQMLFLHVPTHSGSKIVMNKKMLDMLHIDRYSTAHQNRIKRFVVSKSLLVSSRLNRSAEGEECHCSGGKV